MASPAPHTLAFAIRGPIDRDDLPGLCARVCTLLEGSSHGVVLCDVDGIAPDCVTVDALARLQLAARRHDCQVRLRHASAELLELVAFMGLSDVLSDYESSLDGSPKSGNSVSVSRKKVSSPIPPSDTSITWSAQGS